MDTYFTDDVKDEEVVMGAGGGLCSKLVWGSPSTGGGSRAPTIIFIIFLSITYIHIESLTYLNH